MVNIPPASPRPNGTECTKADRPGSSTRFAALSLPDHVSLHASRIAIDTIESSRSLLLAMSGVIVLLSTGLQVPVHQSKNTQLWTQKWLAKPNSQVCQSTIDGEFDSGNV